MKKRSFFSLVLAVVMVFTLLGVFPAPVTADSTDSTNAFSITVGETTTQYSSLIDAVNAVPDGGTIKVLKDIGYSSPNTDNATGILNYSNALKTYTIDGKIDESTKAVINITSTYGLDFTHSNVTLKDLSIVSTVAGGTTAIRVATNSTVTLKDSSVTVEKGAWGVIAAYGNLVIDNSTIIDKGGTGNGQFIHTQLRAWGGESAATDITITLKPGTILREDGSAKNIVTNYGITNFVIYPNVTCTATLAAGAKSVTVKDADGNAYTGDLNSDAYQVALLLNGAKFYANETAATNAGYIFRIDTEGRSSAYYNSLVYAANSVKAGGTVYLTSDWTTNTLNTINISKTFTIDGNNHTMTGTTVQYILDIYQSTLTIQNLNFEDDADVPQMPFRVQSTASLTMKDCTYTVSQTSWGSIGVYGSLTLDNTTVTATNGSTNTAAGGAIRMQASSGVQPSLTLKNGSTLKGAGTQSGIYIANNNDAYSITVETADISVSSYSTQYSNSTVNCDLRIPNDPTEEQKTAWRPLFTLFGVEWIYDRVAQIGENNYYNTMSDALDEVEDDETIVLLANLTSAITVNNEKSFTIDGDGHSVTVAGTVLTVNSGSTVTLKDITITNSSVGQTAIALAGGNLILDSGATVQNGEATSVMTNIGNSTGNGIRVTSSGSEITVKDGASITCRGGAIVADNMAVTVDIQGGTITTGFYFMLFTAGGAADVTISGGTLTSNCELSGFPAFRVYDSSNTAGHSVTISGGTINFANPHNLFAYGGNGAALDPVLPAWVSITGGVINKTTSGSESTLNATKVQEDLEGIISSGTTTLRIPAGASTQNSGIAFQSYVNTEDYDALVTKYGASAVIETGTFILPEASLSSADVTYENISAIGTKLDIDNVNNQWYTTDATNSYWYGSIIALRNANITRDFLGVGYVSVTQTIDGIGTVTYGVCAEGDVANAKALATALTEEQLATLSAKQLEVVNTYKNYVAA